MSPILLERYSFIHYQTIVEQFMYIWLFLVFSFHIECLLKDVNKSIHVSFEFYSFERIMSIWFTFVPSIVGFVVPVHEDGPLSPHCAHVMHGKSD